MCGIPGMAKLNFDLKLSSIIQQVFTLREGFCQKHNSKCFSIMYQVLSAPFQMALQLSHLSQNS